MYIEHPFKYNGVYYAKVDGKLIEITKEQAKVMLSFYRNNRNYEKRWKPKNEEFSNMESAESELELNFCDDLIRELEEEEKNVIDNEVAGKCQNKKKKRKMVLQREMILDCVFSENAAGISVQDLPGSEQPSVEQMVFQKMEYQKLYKMLSKLTEEEQFIIREVFFQDVPQVEVARVLGITPQALGSRLKYIMIRLRRLYKLD